MVTITESVVEEASIDWFRCLGYSRAMYCEFTLSQDLEALDNTKKSLAEIMVKGGELEGLTMKLQGVYNAA